MQNEAIRVTLGTTKYTTIDLYLLDLPPMETRQKPVNTSMQCRTPRIHFTILSKKERGVNWQEASHGYVKKNNQFHMCAVLLSSRKRQTCKNGQMSSSPIMRLKPEYLGTLCHECLTGKASADTQMLIEDNSKPYNIVIYTDGSVTRDQFGCRFTVKHIKLCKQRQWCLQSHPLESDHGCSGNHMCITVADFPE